ncbi:hypothetical protein Bca101_020394 [Brassica carinata]
MMGKKKKITNEKTYWPELFGTVEDLSVSRTVKMLRWKTVTEKSTRIKLAALAIVSSVLLSTNLKMKMVKEHAQMLDEVSLSQNTIALKGFALALQLILVKAVPALTEVVQEDISSSESDSDDEDHDSLHRTKKQNLSPAHAREVDKRTEVLVRSIIPQDPLRPIEEFRLVRSDEACDTKVENLVRLISEKIFFSKAMFIGGVTQKDVEAMREKAKVSTKRKHTVRKATDTDLFDEEKLKSIIAAIIKPDIDRIDAKVSSDLLTLEDVSTTSATIPSSVVATVEAMLKTFKEELTSMEPKTNTKQTQHHFEEEDQTEQYTPPRKTTSGVGTSASKRANIGDKNDEIISNDMESLSEYSTPPGNSHKSQLPDETAREKALSLSGNSQTDEAPDIMPPSFSLGVTQEEHLREPGAGELGAYGGGDSRYHSFVIRAKYSKLIPLLQESWVIHLSGLTVSPKDLLDISQRKRLLPARSYIRETHFRQSREFPSFPGYSFCVKFTRNYPKFKKCKAKDTFSFTKGTIESFKNQNVLLASANRFYFPFNLDRQHWIGLCVDCTATKVYVLDCNPGFITISALPNEVKAISEMFPYLLKAASCENEVSGPFSVERVRGVASNNNPGDAGMSAVLLIQTYALFGPETCRYITESVIPEEAQRAAVMIYEFHEQL